MSGQPGQGGIYWLASYPKSGNTWVRAFISNLKRAAGGPVDINELETGDIASSYAWVEQALGVEIEELSQDEIDRLRPQAYAWLARAATEPGYHKIHDAFSRLGDSQELFPHHAALGALYIVRNPLDVAISFAHHCHCDIDQAILRMGDPAFSFCGSEKRLHPQLRQKLLSWSSHVESWLDAPGLNRLVVRYEDMQASPLETFTAAAGFLELPSDEPSILRALDHCKMETLQKQEKEKGFKERMPKAASFFRKGIAGDWVETLTPGQVDTIIRDHGQVMARLGYLDAAGRPLTQASCLAEA
jgi:aryl sulfotransferase